MEEASLLSQDELSRLCPGLILIENFLTKEEEEKILKDIDENHIWDDRLSRRVQHYGYEFDYASRKAFADHPMIPFPSSTISLLDRIQADIEPTSNFLNQLTINEYLPGQGISAHIDTHSSFGDMMLSISLSSDIVMRFIPASTKLDQNLHKKINLWLPRRALLIMKGPSRFAFKHAIPLRMTDLFQGQTIPRTRRVSLTFRSIRLPAVCNCDFPDACDSQDLILEPTRIAYREPLGIKPKEEIPNE